MPISFGRKSKVSSGRATSLLALQTIPIDAMNGVASLAPSRLVDLRSPEQFRLGFIPGSYNVPDLECWLAARQSGLFYGRQIYLLADHPRQLNHCEEVCDLGEGSEFAGWFDTEALEAWRKTVSNIGQIEAIDNDTLAIRLAGSSTLLLNISTDAQPAQIRHSAALDFHLNELPLTLDGLPVETSICVAAPTPGLASFATSLLWNFGFHDISYLGSSRQ